jgi:hypothetical protein
MTIRSDDVAATLDEIADRIRGAPDRYERAIAITALGLHVEKRGKLLIRRLKPSSETSLLCEDAPAPGASARGICPSSPDAR